MLIEKNTKMKQAKEKKAYKGNEQGKSNAVIRLFNSSLLMNTNKTIK
jgi:hypothetical protein